MREYTNFKDLNFKNFEKTTKMVLAMGQEISIVKTVFETFQIDSDENNTTINKKVDDI